MNALGKKARQWLRMDAQPQVFDCVLFQ
jgi:hypothetical protein